MAGNLVRLELVDTYRRTDMNDWNDAGRGFAELVESPLKGCAR